jgi:hypothetical protein
VFNGTKSGLNAALWSPWFHLPTVDSHLWMLDLSYPYCSDNNYGEMFYNFWLHPDLIDFSGIDVTPLFPELAKKNKNGKLHVTWLRPPMGERHSPYQATQTGRRLKRAALGQPSDPQNIFAWERVELNLPGTPGYQPGRPWISKRRNNGHIAVAIHNYIDDGRATPPTQTIVGKLAAGKQNSAAIMAARMPLENGANRARPREPGRGRWLPPTGG